MIPFCELDFSGNEIKTKARAAANSCDREVGQLVVRYKKRYMLIAYALSGGQSLEES